MSTQPKTRKTAINYLKVNFSTGNKARIEKLNGRDHIVVSLRMIVPGVLNGSAGALLYLPEELGKYPEGWNGMPIVVNHPVSDSGRPLSARSPQVLNKYAIGIVLNSRFDKNLDAEGWFDIALTKSADKRIYDALMRGAKIELSTGLITENEKRKGEYQGVAYDSIARNYKPDHLAVLPDAVGACSLRDGCGVNVNKKKYPKEPETPPKKKGVKRKLVPSKPVAAKKKRKVANTNPTVGDEPMALKPEEKKSLIDNLIGNCDCGKKETPIAVGPWKETDRAILNTMSDEQLQNLEADRVKRVETFRVAEAAKAGFEHGDVGFSFNSATLKFEGKPKEKAPEPIVNTEKKPMTDEEYLASLPEAAREDVLYARNKKQEEKNKFIDQLTANAKAEDKEPLKKLYLTMNMSELELLVKALPAPTTNTKKQPNYAGAAGFANNSQEGEVVVNQDSPLELPHMDWTHAASKKA